jgi:hypothetical protein
MENTINQWHCIDVNHVAEVCSTCGTEVKTLGKCSKCHRAQYCSKICQQKGWKNHKSICNDIKATLQLISSHTSLEEMYSLTSFFEAVYSKANNHDHIIEKIAHEFREGNLIKTNKMMEGNDGMMKVSGSLEFVSDSDETNTESYIYDIKFMEEYNLPLALMCQSGYNVIDGLPFFFLFNREKGLMHGNMLSMAFSFYAMMCQRFDIAEFQNKTITFEAENVPFYTSICNISISDLQFSYDLLGFSLSREI